MCSKQMGASYCVILQVAVFASSRRERHLARLSNQHQVTPENATLLPRKGVVNLQHHIK